LASDPADHRGGGPGSPETLGRRHRFWAPVRKELTMTETSNLQPDGTVVPPVTPEPPPPPGYEDPLSGSGLEDTLAEQPETD
jgi:hypothetical protein